MAKILGFKTFAEYSLPLLCAKNPQNVKTFLDRLKSKLIKLQQQEMDALLRYKKQEVRRKQRSSLLFEEEITI